MLVQIRWQGRKVAVPLSQLTALDPDESTDEAIGDWHYWVVQGYCLRFTHGHRKLTVNLAKGSGEPNKNKVGKITEKQVEEIAKIKMPDLNCFSLAAAVRSVKGTAPSMGVDAG